MLRGLTLSIDFEGLAGGNPAGPLLFQITVATSSLLENNGESRRQPAIRGAANDSVKRPFIYGAIELQHYGPIAPKLCRPLLLHLLLQDINSRVPMVAQNVIDPLHDQVMDFLVGDVRNLADLHVDRSREINRRVNDVRARLPAGWLLLFRLYRRDIASVDGQ